MFELLAAESLVWSEEVSSCFVNSRRYLGILVFEFLAAEELSCFLLSLKNLFVFGREGVHLSLLLISLLVSF